MTGIATDRFLPDCAAVILAGGRSTRFGSDKAAALWHGKPLVEHVIVRVRRICGEVIVVLREGQALRTTGVDQVAYDEPDAAEGPLRGIVAGLRICTQPFTFVLACDAPCVAPALLCALRDCIQPGHVAALPEWRGQLQPLCALYRTAVQPWLEAFLRAGEASPLRVLAASRCRVLPEAEVRGADPAGWSFYNVNTPESLRTLKARTGFSFTRSAR